MIPATAHFEIGLVLPAIILGCMALAVLLAEAFAPEFMFGLPSRTAFTGLTILAFVGAGIVSGLQWRTPLADSAGMLKFDHFTAFLTVVFCMGGILAALLSHGYLGRVGTASGEYYCLMLFAVVGAYLMAAANHLIMVFLGLEVLSVAIYPLAGFLRRDPRANEASLKYFLLGAFSSAFFLYGTALIYGAVGLFFRDVPQPNHLATSVGFGALRFENMTYYLSQSSGSSPLFWGGVGLLIVSFCFKAALAPFHMWTPDAYDGAPMPITVFMGSVIKAAAFAPFLRFFIEVLGRTSGLPSLVTSYHQWALALGVIAVLTMTWGNLSAVAEPSVKRMLAFSSIAHAGYICIAIVAESFASALFYLAVYTLMVIGSFGCAGLMRRQRGSEDGILVQEWAGLGISHPWLGGAFALFLFGLAGFPPTGGFIGKFYIFRAALQMGAGVHHNGYVALVTIALINSLISVYYYLRVVASMFRPVSDDAETLVVSRDTAAAIAIGLSAVGVLVLGVFPDILLHSLEIIYPFR